MKLAILGASGALGKVVTRKALEAGHEVRAFVRSPDKLGELKDRVEVCPGDLADADSIDRAIVGCEAVVSCLGATQINRNMPPLFREGTRSIVDAMTRHGVRRIVVISGAAAPQPGDERSFGNRMLIGLFGFVMGPIVKSNVATIEVLRESDLEWVAVRAANMTNKPGTGPLKAHATSPTGSFQTREDLADFMLAQLTSDEWVGQAPFVSA